MITNQETAAVLGVTLAAVILLLVRRDHLQVRYASWWLIFAVVILVLGIHPKLLDVAASALGIAYSPILALILGVAALLLKMLVMDIEHSKQERDIRRLTQQLAIYEQRESGHR